ncbi:sodium-independent anion transporter [Lewinellaceae bacterium SD302]|nr:sodium-independent anion transporter [Lewinellaceae bacterium SD302]
MRLPTTLAPDWLLKYRSDWLRGDLAAGLTVGIMLIPQGMAYAMLAGLPPIHGLYAATLPLLAYALLGTSRQLAVGPVAMDSLLTAASLGAITVIGAENYLALAALLALLVGGVQLLAGTLRLGFLVDLLSRPIISGFTSAAAIIIGASQLKHLLGIETARSSYVHDILWSAMMKINEVNLPTLLIGTGGILIIILVKKYSRIIPGPLLAVAFGILMVYGSGLTDAGVKIVGSIPAGLPPLRMPAFTWTTVTQLSSAALTIALVGFMESIAVAKAVRNRHRDYELDANRELLALGAANVAAGLVAGYPVTGGFSRTAVNDQAGAKTPLAGIISALLIGLTLLFLTSWFYYLPQAILASLIMVAVFKLIDVREAKRLWQIDRADFWLLFVTFIGTLFLGIQLGIGLGVVLSLIVHIYRSMRPHLAVLGRIPDTNVFRNIDRFGKGVEEIPGVLIIRFDGPLYFGNLSYFQQKIKSVIAIRKDPVKTLILKAEGIHSIDSTALFDLEIFLQDLATEGIEIRFAGFIGPARDALQKSGLRDRIGDHQFYLDVATALSSDHPAPEALQSNEKITN